MSIFEYSYKTLTLGSSLASGAGGPRYGNTKSILLDGASDFIRLDSYTEDILAFSMWFRPTSTIDTTTFYGSPVSFSNIRALYSGSTSSLVSDELLLLTDGYTSRAYSEASGTINRDWHHLVVNYDSPNWEIWLDGTQVDNAGYGTLGTITAEYIDIGRRGTGSYFAGKFAQFALWTDAKLTDSEINDLYNAGLPVEPSSVRSSAIEYWMEEGEGTDIGDSAGSNNATLNGGEWSDDVPTAPWDAAVFDGASTLKNTDEIVGMTASSGDFCLFGNIYVEDVSSIQVIARFGRSNSSSYRTFGIDPNGGDPRFFTGSGTTRRLASTSVVPAVGTWFSFCAFDLGSGGSGTQLVVNDRLLDGTASAVGFTTLRSDATNGVLEFGGDSYEDDYYFTGKMANFGLTNESDDDLKDFSASLHFFRNFGFSNLPTNDKTAFQASYSDINQGGGAFIDNTNAYDLTINGTVTTESVTTFGAYNNDPSAATNSFETDGAGDYLDLSDTYNPTTEIGTGTFSIVLWFNLPDVTPSSDGNILFWGDDTNTIDGGLLIYLENYGELKIRWRKQGAGTYDDYTFSTDPTEDTWYCLVLSRTGSAFECYLKKAGESQVVSATSGSNVDTDFNADDHVLGRSRRSGNFWYTACKFGNYAVFNGRHLTSDEADVIFGDGTPHDLRESRTYDSKTYNPGSLALYLSNDNYAIGDTATKVGLYDGNNHTLPSNYGGTFTADVPS